MWLAVAAALCLLLGYLILSIAGLKVRRGLDMLFYSCLALCFGIGTFSVIFLLARALHATHIFKADLLAVTLLAALRLAARRRRPKNAIPHLPGPEFPQSLRWVEISALAISIPVAAYALIARALVHPHGDGWDAFAIWNLHARFLFLGGDHWRDGYSTLIPWSHPDYPPLLPAAIAHFWTYLDTDSTAIPIALGLIFTAATLGLLYSSLGLSRGHNAAVLGTLTLASTPFFIEQGAAQYADLPLSFFFLATLVLLDRGSNTGSRRLLSLAGLAGGLAAWTKNEGLLFLLSAIIGQALSVLLRKRPVSPRSLRRLDAFGVGAAPLLALIFWFKHYVTPPGDLFASPASMLSKLASPVRYWVILKWYGKELLRFGEWWVVPLTVAIAILYLISSKDERGEQESAWRASIWTLCLTLGGYFAIYLITPNDLYWHLRFSLNRLFLAIWPSVIFLFFSSVSFRSLAKVSK